MDVRRQLTERFEENRAQLRAVAYRMLGSLGEAEDAMQEAWLRLNGTDTDTIEKLAGWSTIVVARVCLDMLRGRKLRREEAMARLVTERRVVRGERADPEGEALLADSVGVALLVVLDTLTPAERLVFVLHDLFGVPLDEIGCIVGRSPAAAKQLAMRARKRVRGSPAPTDVGETVSPGADLHLHERQGHAPGGQASTQTISASSWTFNTFPHLPGCHSEVSSCCSVAREHRDPVRCPAANPRSREDGIAWSCASRIYRRRSTR